MSRPHQSGGTMPMFLNVSFYRKKILADEFGSLLIFIQVGIQPSTCPSRRNRAEIQQDGGRDCSFAAARV